MGSEHLRRAQAKGYSRKLVACEIMGDEILNQTIRKSDTRVDAWDGVRKKVLELWRVASVDMRWEMHASFAVMLTKILLNTSLAEADQHEAVVLWMLNGAPLALGAAVPVDDDEGSDEPAAADDDIDDAADDAGNAAPFPGLLGMLAHGDPTAAGGSVVQNLKLSMSTWAAKVFYKDIKADGPSRLDNQLLPQPNSIRHQKIDKILLYLNDQHYVIRTFKVLHFIKR